MKIMVAISHPKHVYMFENLIKIMKAKGHEFKIILVEKEITGYLLEQINLPFVQIGKNQPTMIRKILSIPILEYRTLAIAIKFRPDVFIGQAFLPMAHVSSILNKAFIVCEDTEIARKLHKFVLPFADAIVTPECFKDDLGNKHVRFKGFFELAYLHPKYYEPDISVLDDLGINKNEKYIIVRFISWHAHHDIGHKSMSLDIKKKILEELEKYGKIFISSESALPDELKKYQIKLSHGKMHSFLYFASLYIGESATMATEAGILGIPSIYISSLARTMGNLDEMEKNYGLMYSYSDPLIGLNKAVELIKINSIKEEWKIRRQRMLDECVDVNEFLIDIIEKINNS